MFVKEIEVYNFRNLQDQVVFFSNNFSVFAGRNGQGKTSLLEAVYLLTNHKSFRCNKTKELLNFLSDDESSYIKAQLETEDGSKSISLNIRDNKKEYLINENKVTKVKELYQLISSVVFTPEDLELVKGSPVTRRGFLDRCISLADPVYLESLLNYHQALKNRNKLLLSNTKISELFPWDSILAEKALIITEKRQKFVEELIPDFSKYYQLICAREGAETVSLKYLPVLQFKTKEDYLEKLAASYEKDLRFKTTTVGPHRDDLEIFINSVFEKGLWKKAKEVASQGQSRSIALALKISSLDYLHRATRKPPLLLLDDVESELDTIRRSGLISLLESFNSQVIITTTDVSLAEKTFGSKADFYQIEAGKIQKI
ncbi:MAG: DNA replication/repair protein RecF [Proteobacteria bacterium]|nr:DNA replication/repair protein RecF [Pseudomonadota bacterium]